MSTPRAVRKNHDPFSLLPPLILVRWTDHCCPHCKQVYRRTYFPASVFLGNGRRTCSACGKVFDDESREWPELRTGQKLRFLLPPPILGLIGGFLLSGVFALGFFLDTGSTVLQAVFVLGVSLVVPSVPTLAWSAIHLPGIRRSTRRYRAVAGRTDLQPEGT